MPRSNRRAENVTIAKKTAKLITIIVSCRKGDSCVTVAPGRSLKSSSTPIQFVQSSRLVKFYLRSATRIYF